MAIILTEAYPEAGGKSRKISRGSGSGLSSIRSPGFSWHPEKNASLKATERMAAEAPPAPNHPSGQPRIGGLLHRIRKSDTPRYSRSYQVLIFLDFVLYFGKDMFVIRNLVRIGHGGLDLSTAIGF